jgi:hypothetical protein
MTADAIGAVVFSVRVLICDPWVPELCSEPKLQVVSVGRFEQDKLTSAGKDPVTETTVAVKLVG